MYTNKDTAAYVRYVANSSTPLTYAAFLRLADRLGARSRS